MKTILFLISILVSLNSAAGINVVDKGGGFAEMLALKADRNLGQYISSCPQQPKYCRIKNSDTIHLQNLSLVLSSLQQTPLEFSEKCSETITQQEHKLIIPSCLLYLSSGDKVEMASIKEISSLILTARALQSGLDLAVATTFKEIFEDFYIIDVPSVLSLGKQQIIAHTTEVGSSYYSKEMTLSVETASTTLDVSDILKKSLCSDQKLEEFKLRFARKLMLDRQRFLFEGDVIWTCGWPYNTKFKGKISLSGLLNEKLDLDSKSVSIILRQKETTW